MKTCKVCRLSLEDSEFQSQTVMCKSCRKEYDKGRIRGGHDGERPITQAQRERKRRWSATHRDPLKLGARRAVRTAIERGELKPFKSCERCHKSQVRRDGGRAIQAHHYLGYENPLAVEWLCPKCHQKADAARADAARKEQI